VAATDQDVIYLKTLIGDTTLTDEQLKIIMDQNLNEDGSVNFNKSAASVWGSKAAEYAGLVNVSESGSSRSLGDLHKNALAMQKSFESKDAAAIVEITRRSRTRAIVRP
jgi:hypothetical protein